MTATATRPPRHHELESADPTELFARWQRDGDHRARERLTARFMPLARKLARRYLGANEPLDDLVQVASLGLLRAIDRFDYERGTAFSSFAVPTILGELRRHFRDVGWAVHVPRGAQERALKAGQVQKELTYKLGRAPTVKQMAEALRWSIDDVLGALEAGAAHHASSLDAPHDDANGEFGALIDSFGEIDDSYEHVEDKLSISAAARRLPSYERRVLRMRFIDDLTQSQIGEQLGVSQMQVSRILRQALGKLREMADPDSSELRRR
ncbi:MAG TPA: SigB/SigF/SigG family RNA polymerase sigma factor [Solirubrobacteraceae bacterium]|jgi:RNA polymerase sigma-B factor|nr:SigB/SigF/SigG family RNA polymerase sigma factor [Solirubrobacteraceae bacterium]